MARLKKVDFGFLIVLFFLSTLILAFFSSSGEIPVISLKTNPAPNFATIPIPFSLVEHDTSKYRALTAGAVLDITQEGELYYSLFTNDAKVLQIKETLAEPAISQVQGTGASAGPGGHYLGTSGPEIPLYPSVNFIPVYEGIALNVQAAGEYFNKCFRLAPFTSPETVQVLVEGGTRINVQDGELQIETPGGIVRALKPIAFTETEGEKEDVEITYTLDGNLYGFALAPYDSSKQLTIIQTVSAELNQSTPADFSPALTADGDGNLFVAVKSLGPDRALSAGIFELAGLPGAAELFIGKYNSSGGLLSAGFLRGIALEGPIALSNDANGNLYIAGSTDSEDFIVSRTAYDSTHHGLEDAFVLKLDSNIKRILASTLLGGNGKDVADVIAVDSNGNVYVAGRTFSPDFPFISSLHTPSGGKPFLARFGSDLQHLFASRSLIDSGILKVNGISFDAEGNVLVNGIGQDSLGRLNLLLNRDLLTAKTEPSENANTIEPVSVPSEQAVSEVNSGSTSDKSEDLPGAGWRFAKAPIVSIQHAKAYFATISGKKTKGAPKSKGNGVRLLAASTVSPEISELARALFYDPQHIFDYVHNHIDYVPYFGSLKGATLTYLDRSGNDFDQASLMIALLRASGYSAEYALCQVEVSGSLMANWLGVDQTKPAIETVLGSGGIPGEVGSDGTSTILRVMVKMEGNYYDPACKRYQYYSKVNIEQAVGYDFPSFSSQATSGTTIGADYIQNVNETNIRASLDSYSFNLVNYIRNNHGNKDIKEIIGIREIIADDQSTEQIIFEDETWTEIPETYFTKLRIQYAGIDYQFSTSDLSGQRITITYAGTDHHPELKLDGALIQSGNATTLGSKSDLTISLDHPFAAKGGTHADDLKPYSIESGRAYAIVYNFGGAGDALFRQRQNKLDGYKAQGWANDSEPILGETMNIIGGNYFKEGELANCLITALADTVSIPYHKVGIVAQEHGYYIDIKNSQNSYISKVNPTSLDLAHLYTASLIYSALEHGILEQLASVANPGVSTVKLFKIANDNHKKIFAANAGNFEAIAGQISHYSPDDIGALQKLAREGATLFIPEDGSLTLNDWQGKGYISRKAITYGEEVEMGIGPGYNGGYGSFWGDLNVPWAYENTSTNNYNNWQCPTSSASPEPIEMATGAYYLDHADLEFAPSSPLNLSFTRSYDSRLNYTKRSFGYGWTHNLDIYIKESSDGAPGLGRRQAVDAAPLIAGFYTIIRVFRSSATLQNWVINSMASKWAVDQLIGNAVTVYLGRKTLEFIKLPDGSYSPPPGMTTTLVRNPDGTYSLRERFGTQLDFNSNKQVSTWTDVDQNRITFGYNGADLTSVSNTFGRSFTLSYSGGLLTRVSDSAGRSVSYSYTNDNLTRYTDPEGKNWGYGYNTAHRMTTLSDPMGTTTATNDYDTLGRVMTQTLPRQNGSLVYNYLFADFQSAEIDPDGYMTCYYYDSKGRENAKVDALSNTTYRVFDGQDHVVLLFDPNGYAAQESYATEFQYDNQNNLVAKIDPYGYVTTNVYDSQFRLTDIYEPQIAGEQNRHRTHYDYNAEHHLILARDAMAFDTTADYYPNGLKASQTDARGTNTTMTYDANGNLHTSQTGEHTSLIMDHYATGNLHVLTDQNGAQTTFTYNNLGQVVTRIDPDGHLGNVSYDDAGRVFSKQDRNGNIIHHSYTPSGKLDTVTYPGSSTIRYFYDQFDNVVSRQDAAGTINYAYDRVNRLISITDLARGFVVSYTDESGTPGYDASGNITYIVYPGNKRVHYTYDAMNRLETVTNWLGETATYYYDEVGRCTGYTHFNGTETYYTLDAANRLTDIDIMSGLNAWVAWYSYALDNNGNRTNVTSGVPVPPPSPVTGSESYAYNAVRNRLMSSGTSSFTYDPEGQLSTGYEASYTFDFEHRLTGIGSAASFTYNGLGNRIRAVRGSETTNYIYDASGNLLAEADSQNRITRYYIYGQGLLSMITLENASYCYHFDGNGNTIALTDSLRNTVSGYAYDAFGTVVDQSEWIPQPFKFVGQHGVMAETNGFYYMRARYYDPAVGRFISEDPIGKPTLGTNLYIYASDNPVMFVDPLGLWTAAVGSTIEFQIGTINLNFSGGFVIDDNGNIGTYTTGGGGLGMGARASGGISISFSNAQTISDLSGPFSSGSLGGGWGANASGDYFTGPSNNGWVTGGGVTIGAGLGAGGSSSITYTRINPIGQLWGTGGCNK